MTWWSRSTADWPSSARLDAHATREENRILEKPLNQIEQICTRPTAKMTEGTTQKCTPYPFSTILFLHLCSRTFDKRFQPAVVGNQSDVFWVNDRNPPTEQKHESQPAGCRAPTRKPNGSSRRCPICASCRLTCSPSAGDHLHRQFRIRFRAIGRFRLTVPNSSIAAGAVADRQDKSRETGTGPFLPFLI